MDRRWPRLGLVALWGLLFADFVSGGVLYVSGALSTEGNQPLELRANDQRTLRIEPRSYCPNLIGGYHGYSATSGDPSMLTNETSSGGSGNNTIPPGR